MKILILIISLFLGFFTSPAFAIEINIKDSSINNIPVGTTFPVSFEVFDAEPNISYYFKFRGGPINDNSSIQTYNQNNGNFLSNNDDWSNMPSFNTDNSGYAQVNETAKIPLDKSYCPDDFYYCYLLFVEIADSVNLNTFNDVPQDLMIFPSNITPSPTPRIPTPTPTIIHSTPTPTIISQNRIPTLTPIPTSSLKFGTSTVSATLSSSESSEISLISQNSSDNFIETGSNPSKNISPIPSKKSVFLPLILIILGIISLITPIIISKIKFKSKCLKK